MIECFVFGKNLPDAYHKALTRLAYYGEIVDCSDYNTRCKEIGMTMLVEQPLLEPMISKFMVGGAQDLQQYLMEMLDGILDFRIGNGWDYTYHDRMVNSPYWTAEYGWTNRSQLDFVVDELKRNPSSRRAFIDLRINSKDMYNDDPPCLCSIQYFIRNGKLDCSVTFRSNDAFRATFMNAFALIMLQNIIANELGVKIGTYTHRANSFHAYENCWDALDGAYKRIKLDPTHTTTTYYYEDDWKEEMEDSIPNIMKKVNELKEKENNA